MSTKRSEQIIDKLGSIEIYGQPEECIAQIYEQFVHMRDKINEIIDYLNKENDA